MHCPSQVDSQQTPSAQKPDLHWLPWVHCCPRPRMPQLPFTQVLGATQSLSEAQVTLQALPWHSEGAQLIGEPITQVPLPLHVEAGVSAPAAQEAGRQTEPAAALEQPPAPLHVPVCPQLSDDSLLQTWCGSITPEPTGPHSPFWLGSAQLTQAPLHAVLQQMPSAQNPDAHSPAQSQAPPRPFLRFGSQTPSSAMLFGLTGTPGSTSAGPSPTEPSPTKAPAPIPALSVVHPDARNIESAAALTTTTVAPINLIPRSPSKRVCADRLVV
jgi:hypothetical protein